MKKTIISPIILLAGMVISASSYGLGMQCVAPATFPLLISGLPTSVTATFDCTNTGPVAYGSFSVTPTTTGTSLNSIACTSHGNYDIQVGDVCAVTVNQTYTGTSVPTMNFIVTYGGESYANIFGSDGVSFPISTFHFATTNSPEGGSTLVIKANSTGKLYARNNGELYENNEGTWVVKPLPASVTGTIYQLYPDSTGNIYSLLIDVKSVWKYDPSAGWTNTYLNTATGDATVVSLSAGSGGSMYALTQKEGIYDVWYYSGSGGASNWTDTHLSDTIGQETSISQLAANMANDDAYVLNRNNIWLYDGNSWLSTGAGSSVSVPLTAMLVNNNLLYAYGRDGVVFIYTTNGWNTLNGPGGSVSQLVGGSNGNLYTRSSTKVKSLPNGALVWQNTNIEGATSDAIVKSLAVDSNGKVDAVTFDGTYDVWQYNGSAWSDTGADNNITDLGVITTLTPDDTGNVYAQAYTGTIADLWKYNGSTWTQDTIGLPLNSSQFAILPGSNQLFAITPQGIKRYDGGVWSMSAPISETYPLFSQLYADSSHLYAVATVSTASFEEDILQYNTATSSWESTGFSGNVFGSPLAVAGVLYAINNVSAVEAYQNGSWSDLGAIGLPTSEYSIYGLVADSNNNLYALVDVDGVENFYRYYQGVWINTHAELAVVTSVVGDSTGHLYVVDVTESGAYRIWRYNGSSWVQLSSPISDDTLEMSQLTADNKGNVYVVTQTGTSISYQNNVYQYNGSAWVDLDLNSASNNADLIILATDSNGYLYASTANGVYIYGNSVWRQLDSQSANAISLNGTVLYEQTLMGGVYKATLVGS